MNKVKRDITKRLRFNAEQAAQLGLYLEEKDMGFTQLIHALIKHELNKKCWPYVINFSESYLAEHAVVQPCQLQKRRGKKNTAGRPVPQADPKLLFALGRIGTNVNQLARSLNYLCLQHTSVIEQFSFIDCIDRLERIHSDLHQYLPSLPIYSVTEEQSQRRKARAIALSEKEGR
ncbi:hypothetical protein AY605_14615 [Acinetobacter sp. SFD]|uniref:plasmid mobilization relaxosome protein MobC n=1 Tax=Acinetobacter sp. SFD TaxID=1805635 RepID=UPI0007D0A042|nr:plasmid mobilization relaxosome protein MobC [Acinetobacter sp. SFD]OAL85827.1 hypothetical protein AY605_14615 [Acinetobacter sp. SFD]